jgi:hypothetical protein
MKENYIPTGGIEDLGNFQEGFCFKIKGQSKINSFKWVICADDYSNKANLMKKLLTLTLRNQSNLYI